MMYDIFTLEVMEDYTVKSTAKLFGHKHVFTTEREKGDKFSINHRVDDQTQMLIDEGKLKLLGSMLGSYQ